MASFPGNVRLYLAIMDTGFFYLFFLTQTHFSNKHSLSGLADLKIFPINPKI